MSLSATPATRNEATPHVKPPKVTPSGKLTIGTAIWSSRGRLRTVADGCGRLRTAADGCGRKRKVERTHPQPPDSQSETGTLATHSGKRKRLRHQIVASKDIFQRNLTCRKQIAFLLRNYVEPKHPKLFFAEITLCRNYPVLELSCS